jgi:transcriptional regulator with XRE-family HTH domain
MSATSSASDLGGAAHASPVGQLLREWRTLRGLSQLELAMHAGFSARHVSFVETGRTLPSRQTVLTLADSLDIPLRERNRVLDAAGYAHVYRHTPLTADEMAHVRSVLKFVLERHEPYAATVQDRYSNCLMQNGPCCRLLASLVDPSLLTEPVNFLRATFHPLGARRWIHNWPELSRYLLERTEHELGVIDGDPTGKALLDELKSYGAAPAPARRVNDRLKAAELLVPIHIRKGDLDLRLFCTYMSLGTPQDVTLQELRIETLFPADEPSERTWKRVTGE